MSPWARRGTASSGKGRQNLEATCSKRDGSQRTDEDEWPEWQVAGAGCPVQGQERATVDGGHGEGDEGAGQERLPADPAQRGAGAGGELGIPRPRPPGLMTARIR